MISGRDRRVSALFSALTSQNVNPSLVQIIDIFTTTDAGRPGLDKYNNQKHKKYTNTFDCAYANKTKAQEERNFEFVTAVSALQKFYKGGRPEVMLLGINLDGSLNGAFLDFLTDLAEIKFPATVNTRSYMVRRSLAITRWIRNIQVAFLRSVSDNIARSAALYSSQSREVVESILTNMPNTGINP